MARYFQILFICICSDQVKKSSTLLPDSEGTICYVMSILIIPGDNCLMEIIGSKSLNVSWERICFLCDVY